MTEYINAMFLLVNNWVENDRNAIERCARPGPKKLTKTYNKGFPNFSTLFDFCNSEESEE